MGAFNGVYSDPVVDTLGAQVVKKRESDQVKGGSALPKHDYQNDLNNGVHKQKTKSTKNPHKTTH